MIETYVYKFILVGANVNASDNLGKTPLLLALEDGKFEIAEYLIKHGSDVNSVDDLGQSALLHITRGERRDCARIIRILLQCGKCLLSIQLQVLCLFSKISLTV